MDVELLKLVKVKKERYKAWLKNRTTENWLKYKTAKNKATNAQRRKKLEYTRSNIEESKTSKELWRTTKNVLGWNKKSGIRQVEVDGQLETDREKIATTFNGYFIEKIQKINDNIPTTDKDPLDYTRNMINDFEGRIPQFNLRRVDKKEIRNHIMKLRTTTSTSHDDISTLAMKKLCKSITPLLKRIVILSFETNTYPDLWKCAKIVPIYKGKGETTSTKNYRPVALLPSLSKVLEGIMVTQLTAHFEQWLPITHDRMKRLLSERQHGYRAKMSCSSTILQLLDDILKNAEDGKESSLLMCDLSAAFDTVDHQLLIQKLKYYGLSDDCISWFLSYLSNRKQYVEVNGSKSATKPIKIGVFQGSVGGPLLFILFFNDLMTLEDDTTGISMYADDNNYLCTLDKDKLLNQLKMKKKLEQIEEYMNSNGLKFNVEKTQLMTMNPGHNRSNDDMCWLLF